MKSTVLFVILQCEVMPSVTFSYQSQQSDDDERVQLRYTFSGALIDFVKETKMSPKWQFAELSICSKNTMSHDTCKF